MKIISRIIKFVLRFVLVSVAIYFCIVAVLIATGKPETRDPAQRGLTFDELFFDYSGLPELKYFTARDGVRLGYRYYSADSDKILILLHGAAWHSRYFLPLAEYAGDP
ncbi:MAG: alpha/beta hydrolase, partial [Deltaproteobacteria bacterium]|nr:alpha/beta hydrolase [Deltaproteobacteria bacterium]